MEPVTLTPDTIQQLKKVLLQGFEEAGLVLLPRDAAKFSLKYYETRNKLLQQEWVTAHKAAKYALVPTIKSVDTYKNYIKNGKISSNDQYQDDKGTYYVSTRAIKRLTDES